jgi:glycosyltransferase involved in cell wall biosynthesis
MKVISFHPFRQHNFEQAEYLNRVDGIQMILHSTIALPPFFRFLNSKRNGRVISWSLFFRSRLHFQVFSKYLLNREMEGFVESFQKSVICKLKRNTPDVIIGFDGCSKIVFEEFKGKVKLVLDFTTILDTYNFVINPKSYTDRITYLNNNLLTSSYYVNKIKEIELADLILVGSNQVRNSILHQFPEFHNKISVLHYGYNESVFENKKSFNHAHRRSIKFLIVGTLSFHKGSDVILKVWDSIVNIMPNAELHICGKCYPEFEHYLQNPGIKYHGFVDQKELSEMMKKCDVLVHPTYVEGFSISVLQALVSGMAIIATDHTGCDLINNLNGKIINVGSEIQLFEAMIELIENQKLIEVYGNQNSRQFSHLTWLNYADKLNQELLKLCE